MLPSELELDDFLPYRLSVAANAVSRAIARSYERPFGLKVHEWRVVAVLAAGGELTQQDIVGRTQMDKVAVSRAAQSLERRRLLRRAPDAEDGRSLRLSLTAEGRRVHGCVTPSALAIEAEVRGELDGRELAALKDMLRRLERAAARAQTRPATESHRDAPNGSKRAPRPAAPKATKRAPQRTAPKGSKRAPSRG